MNNISPQLQNQIAQFQQLQQQMQSVLAQKYQMEAQLKEVERTLEQLEKTAEDATIYRNVGSLLIKAESKTPIIDELEDSVETLGIRIKAIDRQEKQMQERYQSLQQSLSTALQGQEMV